MIVGQCGSVQVAGETKSGTVLKVEPVGLADRWDLGCGRSLEVTRVSGPSN